VANVLVPWRSTDLVEIGAADFALIVDAMQASLPARSA
jgi:hypothetical protein